MADHAGTDSTPTAPRVIRGAVTLGSRIYRAGDEDKLHRAMQGRSFDRLLAKGVIAGDWSGAPAPAATPEEEQLAAAERARVEKTTARQQARAEQRAAAKAKHAKVKAAKKAAKTRTKSGARPKK